MPTRLLTILRPPIPPLSSDVAEHREYMKAVSKYHLNVSIIVAVLVIAAVWAASPVGFARSANIEIKIEEKLEPVKIEINSIKGQTQQVSEAQAANGKLLRNSLANTAAGEMRFLASKECSAKDVQEREYFQKEIDRKQDEYSEYKGFKYTVPGCKRL